MANLFTCSPALAMTMQVFVDPAFALPPSGSVIHIYVDRCLHVCVCVWIFTVTAWSFRYFHSAAGSWTWQLWDNSSRNFLYSLNRNICAWHFWFFFFHSILFFWHFQYSSHILKTALFSCHFYLYKKRERCAKKSSKTQNEETEVD